MYVLLDVLKNGKKLRAVLRLDAVVAVREHEGHPVDKKGCTVFTADSQQHEVAGSLDDVSRFLQRSHDLRPLLRDLWSALRGREELDGLLEDSQTVKPDEETARRIAVLRAAAQLLGEVPT